MPEDVEEVSISFEDVLPVPISEIEWSVNDESGAMTIAGKSYSGIRLDRLLVKCGLAESGADASRKLKEGAVKVNDGVEHNTRILVMTLPTKLSLRVGRRMKIAVIHR